MRVARWALRHGGSSRRRLGLRTRRETTTTRPVGEVLVWVRTRARFFEGDLEERFITMSPLATVAGLCEFPLLRRASDTPSYVVNAKVGNRGEHSDDVHVHVVKSCFAR